MKTTWTYTSAFAFGENHIYISASADDRDPFARYTELFEYDGDAVAPSTGKKPFWGHTPVQWRAVSVAEFALNLAENKWAFCALSEEGDISYSSESGFNVEKIHGAGVFSKDAQNWGYLHDLRQIGSHLYACGYSGQVYKRIGRVDWIHIDRGLLQPPTGIPSDQRISLEAINGPHENAIYAAGHLHANWLPPKAFFYTGHRWRELKLPEAAERITNIYVESETRIWMCGANGTLLLGNAQDGFKSLSTANDNQLFASLCMFQGKMYLGSNLGLFVYDPADHEAGIREVVTNLKPELQDAHIVDSYKKVLWSIGNKDIARFDGEKWERIHDPDNPRIGE